MAMTGFLVAKTSSSQVVLTGVPLSFGLSFGLSLLVHVGAAVDGECLTGDEAGVGGEEERDRLGDVLGLLESPQRGVREHHGAHAVGRGAAQLGLPLQFS